MSLYGKRERLFQCVAGACLVPDDGKNMHIAVCEVHGFASPDFYRVVTADDLFCSRFCEKAEYLLSLRLILVIEYFAEDNHIFFSCEGESRTFHSKFVMSSRKKICYSHASFCEKCSDGDNFLVGHCADSRQKENLAVIQSAVADLFRCEEIILIKEFLQQVADIVPALEVVAEGTACMDFPFVSLPRMKESSMLLWE